MPRRIQDVDRHVGARMRGRRIMLGLAQPQLADLIGSPTRKPTCTKRASTAWLLAGSYKLARVLGVDLDFF
jgi:hypothetical protein